MARRGALTALQAVLAGVSGGAQGYVQQQELERKRQQERAAQERQQAMDLITFGERAIEPGSLATRAPMGAPRAEAPRTALPPSAVSLPTGPVDFGGAMRQLEQEEARPSGTTPLRIGDITLNIPIGQRARDIKRSEALLAERGALDAAVQQAEAVGAVKTRQERALREETRTEDNRSAYNELVAMGLEREPFQSGRRYTDRLANELEMRKIAAQDRITPYQQAQLDIARRQLELREAEERRRANAPAAQTVGTGDKAFSRADVDFLMQFAPVAQQRDGRTVYQEPASSLNTFGVKFAQYDISNWAVGENEQRYAAVAGAIADAKARASEKGVLTNQDIDRYRRSIIIRPGDSVATKADKFRRMQTWANDLLGTSAPAGLPNNPGEY